MSRLNLFLTTLAFLLFFASACAGTPTAAEPVLTQQPGGIPQSEAEVPRISLEETRAALESGAAIVVDVRDRSAYDEAHIAGSISIPLADIEADPAGLELEKDQQIITYCA